MANQDDDSINDQSKSQIESSPTVDQRVVHIHEPQNIVRNLLQPNVGAVSPTLRKII